MVKALAKKDISNLSCYQKVLDDTSWVMVYFDYAGDNYLAAASAFESIAMRIEALKMAIIPHPRATRYGTSWLQMEWISYIRGSLSSEKSKNAYAMVTTIKPEMEKEYRMLHQSVWPGVVDQMARGNNRNFSIFLVEIGAKIYEFFYVEYVGANLKKDGERNRTDPANLRWWKLTDVCQNPLPGTKDIWTMMDKVESKKEVKK
jgi:L-rhamnose mutarotase